MRRLLDYDPLTRTSLWHDYDYVTDTTTIEEVQDTEPYLERNKAIQNVDGFSKKGIKEEWWHVATIPNGVIMRWKRELGVNVFDKNHFPRVRRLLMDPEWRYLRTGLGNLGKPG